MQEERNMSKDLPLSVRNLRKIWDAKKVQMRFTQVEAAKELGWSQGAISHYLNNITELRAPAIVKLANFLEVDPRDIDPDIERDLPSVQKKIIAFSALDMTKRINETLLSRRVDSSILVKIPNQKPYQNHFTPEAIYSDCYVRLVSPSELKNPKIFAARLKSQKKLSFYLPEELPPASQIHTLWSVVNYSYY
jgi:transcriptional regulator with XRE-family HTH domain